LEIVLIVFVYAFCVDDAAAKIKVENIKMDAEADVSKNGLFSV